MKQITIPRLELAAAVLAARIDTMLKKELQLDLENLDQDSLDQLDHNWIKKVLPCKVEHLESKGVVTSTSLIHVLIDGFT